MPERTPPMWFQARLKAIDRRLSVAWHDGMSRWVISERVPRVSFVGNFDGAALHAMRGRGERVLILDDLGTQVLDYLRRLDMTRYGSVAEMVKALDLDGAHDGAPDVRAATA